MNLRAVLGTKAADLPVIHARASGQEAIRLMIDQDAPALMVTDRGEPLGLLRPRDLLHACLKAAGPLLEGIRVADTMTTEWITADIEEDLGSVLSRVISSGLRCLSVLEAGKPVGLVPLDELLRHRVEELTVELNMLHEYLASLQEAVRD